MSDVKLTGLEPEFLEALERGVILVQRCDDCSAHRFPPMPFCSYCGSGSDRDVELTGGATLYSWIVIHRTVDATFRKQVPYVIGIVDLEVSVGLVRIPARIETEDPGMLVHDQPVELVPPQETTMDIRFRSVSR